MLRECGVVFLDNVVSKKWHIFLTGEKEVYYFFRVTFLKANFGTFERVAFRF